MYSVGEFDVFHISYFPVLGFPVGMLMMIVAADQRPTKHKGETAGRSLVDGMDPRPPFGVCRLKD